MRPTVVFRLVDSIELNQSKNELKREYRQQRILEMLTNARW